MLGAQSNSVDCTISDDTTPDNVKATATNTQNEVTFSTFYLPSDTIPIIFRITFRIIHI